jgi:hypothetical protein
MLATSNVKVFLKNGYGLFSSSGIGGHVQNFGGPLFCKLITFKMKKSSSKRFLIICKSQNEDLIINHKVHLDIYKLHFSNTQIYKDILERFKLEAYELGYGKKC